MKSRNDKEGKTEAQAQSPSDKKAKTPRKGLKTWVWALIITAAVLVVLVGTVAIWWACEGVESFREGWTITVNLFSPPENDVFYKDSYTASDKKVAEWNGKVVATVGDAELTNGELQAYYWMNVYDFLNNYGYYAVYAGLDYTKPLDEQTCPETDGGTWQHFFLDDALMGWHKYQALALMAEKEGVQLTEDMQKDLDNLRSVMAQQAVSGGFSSIDAMLKQDMGAGVTYEDYYTYTETYYKGYVYFEKLYDEAAAAIDDDVLEIWFKEHSESLSEDGVTKESGKLYDVRHILIAPEGGTKDDSGNVTYSEAEWEACRAAAQKILDDWLAGEATEEAFARLANEHSIDTGSNTNGGLYEGLDKDTNFVQEYKDWYLDESRKAGDYGLVKSDYGYHIMYFSGAEEEWKVECREGILTEKANEIAQAAMEAYPISVTYKDIVIGYVDLAATQASQNTGS